MHKFALSDLVKSDLIVDALYEGGRAGGAGDDPLPKLVGVSTGGGFRYRGKLDRLELVVLTSNKKDPDWPDHLDRETGVYTYYGDNKIPGRDLHDTPRFGNAILQRIFEDANGGAAARANVPPVLVFTSGGERRDVVFLGLAVPGVVGEDPSEGLVAVWRSRAGSRFQNYRAHFTVLKAASISRNWIASIIEGNADNTFAPPVWENWKKTGQITPLLAPRTIQHRKKAEQQPATDLDREIVGAIHEFFSEDPFGFERCAAQIARFMLPSIASLDLTRRSRDGGRDGIGQYRIGVGPSSVVVDFALEAKCYGLKNPVGVREMARLISRLRHRQFGVLVTTSYVDEQAYKEIKEDEHPIVVISGADIASLLRSKGLGTASEVRKWLEISFPSTL
ncbi:restriction endonuclease [Lysobacter sp. 2RAF19]